jgi:hypothetical protein
MPVKTSQDDSIKLNELRVELRRFLPTFPQSSLLTSLLSSDDHLRRFLTARNGQVKAATTMIESALKYREQHKLDAILDSPPPPLSLRLLHQHAWHGYDKENRPIYIDNFGHIDLDTIEKTYNAEQRLHYHHYYNEYFVQKVLPQAVKRAGHSVDQVTIIYDMSGFTTRLLTTKHIAFIMSVIQCNSLIYPENLGSVWIVNAPFTFAMAWAIVKHSLTAKQIEKIHIHRGVPKDALLRHIDASELPHYLGGQCQCDNDGVYEDDGYFGCIAATPLMLELHDHMKLFTQVDTTDHSLSITRVEPSTPSTPVTLTPSDSSRSRAHSDSAVFSTQSPHSSSVKLNDWSFHQTTPVLLSVS